MSGLWRMNLGGTYHDSWVLFSILLLLAQSRGQFQWPVLSAQGGNLEVHRAHTSPAWQICWSIYRRHKPSTVFSINKTITSKVLLRSENEFLNMSHLLNTATNMHSQYFSLMDGMKMNLRLVSHNEICVLFTITNNWEQIIFSLSKRSFYIFYLRLNKMKSCW